MFGRDDLKTVPEPLYGDDLILLLLGAPTAVGTAQDRVNGITRLEKLLFLADQEQQVQRDVADPLVFEPYHYGPYSKKVYEAVELLEEAGLIGEERSIDDSTFDEAEEVESDVSEEGPIERRFYLTDQGRAVAQLLLQQNPGTAAALSHVKDTYASMPLAQLIRYVYRKYEPFTVRSRIRDQVL